MALTGYKNRCSKNSGGIESIKLIEIGKLTDAEYDPATDSYSEFRLAPGAAFADYQFRETEAMYREKVSLESGSVRVSHELSFVIDQTDTAARVALEQLIEASKDGMVAVVTTNNRESFVVGYSQIFRHERPLKLIRATSASGTEPAEQSSQIVYLYSEDTQKAKSYCGLI